MTHIISEAKAFLWSAKAINPSGAKNSWSRVIPRFASANKGVIFGTSALALLALAFALYKFIKKTDCVAKVSKRPILSQPTPQTEGSKPEDIWKQNNCGTTFLHYAAASGQLDTVKKALKTSAPEDIWKQSTCGKTFLHYAAASGHLNIVKEVLTNINSKPENTWKQSTCGKTFLHYAAESGHLNIVKEVLTNINSKPENIWKQDHWGQTFLHSAAASGHLNIVKEALETSDTENIWTQNNNGETFLHSAAASGHLNIVKEALETSDTENIWTQNNNGETLLHYAARSGYLNIVKEVLTNSKPEDIWKQSIYGRTFLHYAARSGYLNIVKEVLTNSKPEDIWKQSIYGRTFLHSAAESGHLNIVKEVLISSKPEDIWKQDNEDRIFLHHVNVFNSHKTIHKLLDEHKIGLECLFLNDKELNSSFSLLTKFNPTPITYIFEIIKKPEIKKLHKNKEFKSLWLFALVEKSISTASNWERFIGAGGMEILEFVNLNCSEDFVKQEFEGKTVQSILEKRIQNPGRFDTYSLEKALELLTPKNKVKSARK